MFYHWQNSEFDCIEQGLKTIPLSLPDGAFCKEEVKKMDLSFNSISTLVGLEHFKNLDTLILDNNDLTDEYFLLPYCPKLTYLSLNKNKLKNLEALLTVLKESAPALKYLCLLGNPACPHPISGPEFDIVDHDRYRIYVVYRLPQLRWLDSSVVKPAERDEAVHRGEFLRVVRMNLDDEVTQDHDPASLSEPLPNAKDLSTHAGMYGVLRYRYSGKNSEGNRFIRNNDL